VPRSFAKQAKINKLIYSYFSKPNCIVVQHLNYLGKQQKWIRNHHNYASILEDQVHLKSFYYKILVENIIERIILKQPLRRVYFSFTWLRIIQNVV
jgi:hypothetical protein